MSLPTPEQGLVIRYAYLWQREQAQGKDDGVKDRPCAVILSTQDSNGDQVVVVLPITHRPPDDPTLAMAIPAATKERLGLDDAPSWIILSEGNKFVWPGPDLRPVHGQGLETVAMGYLPRNFIERLREQYIQLHAQRKTLYVDRSG